jgi:hypothetical protein
VKTRNCTLQSPVVYWHNFFTYCHLNLFPLRMYCPLYADPLYFTPLPFLSAIGSPPNITIVTTSIFSTFFPYFLLPFRVSAHVSTRRRRWGIVKNGLRCFVNIASKVGTVGVLVLFILSGCRFSTANNRDWQWTQRGVSCIYIPSSQLIGVGIATSYGLDESR